MQPRPCQSPEAEPGRSCNKRAVSGPVPLSLRCGARARGSLRRWKSAAGPGPGTGMERSRLGPGAIADPKGCRAMALWRQVGEVSACVSLTVPPAAAGSGPDVAGVRACCRCGLVGVPLGHWCAGSLALLHWLGDTAPQAQGRHSAGTGCSLSCTGLLLSWQNRGAQLAWGGHSVG